MASYKHIEQLIQDLCPSGVDTMTLGDATIVARVPKKLQKKDYYPTGTYPIIDQGKEFIVGYTEDENALLNNEEYVLFGDHTREVKYVDFPFAQGADGLKVLKPKPGIIAKYLYYCLKDLDIPSRGYNRHWSIAKELSIPIPPYEIQREIILQLDVFVNLIDNIDEEIKAREIQYANINAYYMNTELRQWHTDTIGKLGRMYSGLSGKTKSDFGEGNAKFVTYKNVYFNPAIDIKILEAVKVGANENQNAVQYGDVLFTGSSETPDECAISSVVNQHLKEKIYLNSFCFGFRFNDLSEIYIDFYKHYFRSAEMRGFALRASNGTTRFNVSKDLFEAITIPVPPIAEQRAIAEKLDTIEAFINNLKTERDLRQQQYEYYREYLINLLK